MSTDTRINPYRSDGGKWVRARAGHLRSHPWCVSCAKVGRKTKATHVDHRTPHRGDMKLFWDKSLWDSLCETCHNSCKQHFEKTGHERGCSEDGTPLDPKHHWSKPVLTPFVILVGQAGVGKSAIRKHLAPLLDAVALGPDDFSSDWPALYARLDQSPHAVVECCIVPGRLAERAEQRGVFIVELTLSDSMRRDRLEQRGHAPEAIQTFMAQTRRLGYEHPVYADLTLDAGANPQQTALTIANAVHSRGQTLVKAS